MNNENKKSYLPSSQFQARIILLLILFTIVSGGIFIYDYFKNKKTTTQIASNKHQISISDDTTVSDILSKDTNINGIPDWEESFWNLDPTIDGQKNKEFIEKKKAEMISASNKNDISKPEPENETDQLAREFIAYIMAMNHAGTLNTETIKAMSDSIVEKIANTETPDTFILNDIKIVNANKTSLKKYQSELEKVIIHYQDINFDNELSIMVEAIEKEDPIIAQKLSIIANAYKSMAREMSKIPSPKIISQNHLELINLYEKMGTALDKMSEISENPIVAMTGTVMYSKYTKQIDQVINSIRIKLVDNGIL